MMTRGGVKGPYSEGRPIMKKAQAKTTHGAESTQTDGLIRNNVYQASVPAMKMEQMMYRSVSFSVLDPESKLNWKDV